jgi:predicted lactoylglutathione lyase
MALELYMVGLTVSDMEKSLEFYRRVGVAIPEVKEGQPHVPVQMHGGMTFFLDTRTVPREDPELREALGDYRVLLEFYLPSREAVDAKYNELVGSGYRSYHAPFVTASGMYFALVDDPDGNTILFSSD